MKYAVTLFLLCCLAVSAGAQTDTLQYDGLNNTYDGQLVAATRFPGELDVVFNVRFSPTEKCILNSVLVGFSVVKFHALTGNDTLVVFVFENGTVPPSLTGLGTYKVNLGDAGFPNPNIRFDLPLEAGARDVLAVKLNPPVIFSPRRDFIVGAKLISTQKYAVGQGLWNGFSVLVNPSQPEYERSRRYMISPREEENRNDLATQGAEAAIFMRALVGYNPDLPLIEPTGNDAGAELAESLQSLDHAVVHPRRTHACAAFRCGRTGQGSGRAGRRHDGRRQAAGQLRRGGPPRRHVRGPALVRRTVARPENAAAQVGCRGAGRMN